MTNITAITRRLQQLDISVEINDETTGLVWCGDQGYGPYGAAHIDAIAAALDAADEYEPTEHMDEGDQFVARFETFHRAVKFRDIEIPEELY